MSEGENGLSQEKFVTTNVNELLAPKSFSELKGGKFMIDTLQSRSIFKDKPAQGRNLFINLQTGERSEFNTNNWQLSDFDTSNLEPQTFSSIVIVAGQQHPPNHLSLPEDDENVAKTMEKNSLQSALLDAVALLDLGGSVIVFEKGNEEGSKSWRLDTLKDTDLVRANILNRRKKHLILWEAAMHKGYGGTRKPVNYYEDGPKWRREWLDGIMKERDEEQMASGYMVVDDSEILNRMKKTKNVQHDLWSLRHGLGVKVMVACGCEWAKRLNGDTERTHFCNDQPCDGFPKINPVTNPNADVLISTKRPEIKKEETMKEEPLICRDFHTDGKEHYMTRGKDGIARCPQHRG